MENRTGLGTLIVCLAGLAALAAAPQVNPQITVRDGFTLSVAQGDLRRPRFLEFDPAGTLYVSLPDQGKIVACRDTDGDGYFETTADFVTGRRTAHAMQWHDGRLWFTQTDAVLRARDTDGDGKADETETVIPDSELTGGTGHWWRSLLVLDGRIYTSVGDRGNISIPEEGRQKIFSFALDGSDRKLFISGIRNTEKLVVRPGTREIWGMDHGSDHFGRVMEEKDDADRIPITSLQPPDEMNHYVEGGFYGHPFIVGDNLPRYEYMDRDDIVELAARNVPPAWKTGAHWAPNAMEFYDADQFPAEYRGDAFVAYHGSWNRASRAGYCVTRVLFDAGKPYGELKYVDFLTADGDVLGRPVDVALAPDGTLFISDDHRNTIYRLKYAGPSR